MKLALYQGPSFAGDVASALKKVEDTLSSAAMSGAQMVVFPELFLPGYNQPDLHRTMAQPPGGPWEQELSRMAAASRCGLTIGWSEKADGKAFNSASCFDHTGKKIAGYRKIQLWGPMEKASFEFGNAYTTFQLGEFKAALLICYDVEFAHHVKALKDQGVELLLVPTACGASFPNVANVIVRARALETGMTIAYANYCGSEADLEYAGLSIVVGPDGEPLAQADTKETILIADLEHIKSINPSLLSTQHQDYRELN